MIIGWFEGSKLTGNPAPSALPAPAPAAAPAAPAAPAALAALAADTGSAEPAPKFEVQP